MIGAIKTIYKNKKLIFISLYDFLARGKNKYIRPKTLLLIRLDSIGDYILFRNFIKYLKESKRFSDYGISLVGNIIWKDLAETYDKKYIDEFIWVDRKRFCMDRLYRLGILSKINQRGVEIVIQPTFSREYFVADAIVAASGAIERIGSAGDISTNSIIRKIISDRYYTHQISTRGEVLFEFYRNKEFFEALLNEKIYIEKPTINVNEVDFQEMPTNKYVVISPGAGDAFRRWSANNFSKAADYISCKYNFDIVITGGSGDSPLANEIISKSSASNVIDLTGKITLGELTKILSEAVLVLTNESATAHISVAIDCKTICISTGNHFGVFNPYPSDIFNKIYYIYPTEIMSKINDFDYLSKKYRYGSKLDINSIKVEEVLGLVDRVIEK
jgi:ADP-heptose:LPS heptosyltransferase